MMNENDSWLSPSLYDRFMGRWSAQVSQKFLEWLDVTSDRSWLDVGCGTGSLTKIILETKQPRAVVSLDSSHEFISYARQRITDHSVRFMVGQAQSIDLESNSIDVAVSGLVLNFVPKPIEAVTEMLRVVKPGGDIGIFLWHYSGGMEMLRYFWDAAAALDNNAVELDEGVRFPICREGQLTKVVRAAGMKQIETIAIDIPTIFEDFDDYWQPFLGGIGPAPNYVMGLNPTDRRKLRARVQKSLPTDADGSISLTARAWAVKGRVTEPKSVS